MREWIILVSLSMPVENWCLRFQGKDICIDCVLDLQVRNTQCKFFSDVSLPLDHAVSL